MTGVPCMRVKLWLMVALLAAATGAQAVSLSSVGQSFSVGFNGVIDNIEKPGLTSEADFALTGISADRKEWTFTVDLTNTSTAPITGSRISILGFNTDPNVNRSASSVSGVYDIVATGNMPMVGTVEICLKGAGGPNCAGGGGEGVTLNNTAQFVAKLAFNNSVAALVMDGFVVRYQAISGSSGSSGVGFGTATAVVPLPAAAWLFGSGILALVGLRRRSLSLGRRAVGAAAV